MEAFRERRIAMLDRAQERLSYIVCVDMVDGLHAEIGNSQRFAAHNGGEDLRIKVALRVDGVPALAHKVAGMQDCYWERIVARLGQEVTLNLCLSESVVSKWSAMSRLGSGDFYAVSMNPDRAAVQKLDDPSPQRFH